MFGFSKPKEELFTELYSYVDSLAKIPGINSHDIGVLARELREKFSDSSERSALEMGLKKHGWTVQEWATTFIINILADQIESGQFHVYRGVLGAKGKDLLETLELLIKQNVEIGTYTRDYADKNILDVVKRNIARIG